MRAFQARHYKTREFDSRCFFLLRTDGSVEDFSYRKCLLNLCAIKGISIEGTKLERKQEEDTRKVNTPMKNTGGRGRGRGRGGGRGGRGRGRGRGR